MFSQLYPTSPSYNVFIAFGSLYTMSIIHSLKSSFLLTYLAFMSLSIIMDLNWLIQMALMGFMVRVVVLQLRYIHIYIYTHIQIN